MGFEIWSFDIPGGRRDFGAGFGVFFADSDREQCSSRVETGIGSVAPIAS
jgi:hypothetical protein